MPLHVKPSELGAWLSKADEADAQRAPAVTLPRKRPKKRTPAQLRADLERAIERSTSELGRRVLTTALERMDQEAGRKLTN